MPTRGRILIVDDEETLVHALCRHFERRGFDPHGAYLIGDAVAAIDASVRERRPFAAILTDLQLPDGDGRSLVRLAHERLPNCPVLVMTGSRSVSGSVEAMRLGAVTVLEKPVVIDALEAELQQAIADRAQLQGGLDAAAEAGIVGGSPAIRALLDVLLLAAPTNATVLIQGETGTGKELVAQALHRLSRRSSAELVAVNCAALPEALLESELFGHTRGAFTGAVDARPGRFRQANGGTLFLDEIGEMPVALQAKLLRVLQEGEVQPLGSDKAQPVDVRVIAATSRDLRAMADAGTFRSDLYYRLNVVPVQLPALRERAEDIAPLAAHFLRKRAGRRFTAAALAALQRYPWPGNVRELENLVERLVVLHPSGDLDAGDLPEQFRNSPADALRPALTHEGIDLYAVLGDLEERLINEALEAAQGNKNQAARALGLNRTTLVEKLKRMSRK